MKQIFATVGFLFFVCIASAQAPLVGIDAGSYDGADTTRIFQLFCSQRDACIDQMVSQLGAPVFRDAGTVEWRNISIPEIGSGLKILLHDGILVIKDNTARYTYFKNDSDKQKKLGGMKTGQSRRTTIEIQDSSGKNYIVSHAAEKTVLKYLEGLLKGM